MVDQVNINAKCICLRVFFDLIKEPANLKFCTATALVTENDGSYTKLNKSKT